MAKKKTTEKKLPPCCGNCFYAKDAENKRHDVDIYACRRFPPSQDSDQQTPGRYPNPMVASTDWCGEYKPK